MKRSDVDKVLIIGSGPIVIGQACEFDYSGTQACKALRACGYKVVLVNSNPATIMTDPVMADATYIEPLNEARLEQIIAKERPDAILPNLGGQTGLNLSMELAKKGILDKYGVKVIGVNLGAIERGEDREVFKETMQKLGIETPRSGIVHSVEAAIDLVDREIGYPVVVRPAYTMGGSGGGFCYNVEELRTICARGLDASLTHQCLIEESILNWEELEVEVVRDSKNQMIAVCFIENIDAVGVHTGDSFCAAPFLTIDKKLEERLQRDAFKIVEAIGVIGGTNVQFAHDPKTGRVVIIEINPRTSRSSALASKATGFPIAKIAALLAVGFTLDEIQNDITGRTLACFEPALDYVVVKIPRFAFEKFPGAPTALGTQMKSVGEVMALGRTFKQAYLKAVRSLEAPLKYHDETSYDPWFKAQLAEIEAFRRHLSACGAKGGVDASLLRQAKAFGFGDREIAEAVGSDEAAVRKMRIDLGIRPEFGEVDTCAGEFEAVTPYYYSYYQMSGGDGPQPPAAACGSGKRKIMILGGGPNRIGQGIEFDWCCCHAAYALRRRGFEVVMVNSNPETVSTDYDTSDRLYFEPLAFEDVMEIYERERCDGVVVQFGGQTPLNLAQRLKAAGARVIGTSPDDIDRAEDRDFFKRLVEEVGVRQPASGIAHSTADARRIAAEIGYPVLVRPSFVLGGRGMAIVATDRELDRYVGDAVAASGGKPVLVDKFLEHAIELDVDCVSDGRTTVVGGILEHVEAAGCHSGDAAAITPPRSLSPETVAEVKRIAREFAKRLRITGLMNIQLAVTKRKDGGGDVWMIEVNPRASRTVPFVSKAAGVPLADIAARCMAGETLEEIGFTEETVPAYTSVKEAVFPFVKFPGAEVALTPEMKSTGEVMAIDEDPEIAYFKSQIAAGSPLPKSGEVFVALRDEDKEAGVEIVRRLVRLGYGVYATCGTSTRLREAGIPSKAVFRISRGRPNALDLLGEGALKWIVCTVENGREATEDNARLRSGAVAAGVPLTTTLDGFRAAVDGLAEEVAFGGTGVRTLQEYHKLRRAT